MAKEPAQEEKVVEKPKLSAQEMAALAPAASPLSEQATPETDPAFGMTAVDAPAQPDINVQSPSIDFLAEGMQARATGAESLDAVADTDRLGQIDQNTEMAANSLRDSALSPADRAAKAKAQLDNPPARKSIGQIYMDMIHPGTPDVAQEQLSTDFTVKAKDEEHKALMVHNLTETEQPFEEYATTPSPVYDEIIKSMRQDAGDTDFADTVGNNLIDALDYASPFFDPKNDDDQLEVDITDIISETLDVTTPFTFVDDKNAAIFEKRYGTEWRGRMFAWMAKEIAIDAAVLVAATFIPPLAPYLAVASQAQKGTRVGRALVRASVVGVAGGSTHATINNAIGRDANLGLEVGVGFAGTLGGEALVRLLAKGIKAGGGKITGAMKSVRDEATAGTKMPVSNSVEKSVRDFRIAKDPVAVTEVKASLFSMSRRFQELSREVSKASDPGAFGKEQDLIVKRIAAITGYKPEQISTELAIADKIFFEEELGATVKSLGKQQAKVDSAAAAEEALATAKKTKDKVKIAAAQKVLNAAKIRAGKAVSAGLSTGNTQADRILLSNAIGTRVMGDTAMRQNLVADEFFSYVYEGQMRWRPDILEADKKIGAGNLLGRFTKGAKGATKLIDLVEPDQLPMNGLAKDYMDSLNLTSKYVRVFQRALMGVDKGLSAQERAQVDRLLTDGSNLAKVYQPDDLIDFAPAVRDAYYATRSLLDMNHYVLDRAITARAIKDGVGTINGVAANVKRKVGTKIGKETLTTADVKEGKVLIQEIARDGQKQLPRKVLAKDVGEVTSMLPSHTGYIPRSYKDANYHVSVANTATGNIQRTHALPHARAASDAAKALEKELGPDEIVINHSWDNVANSGEVGFSKNSMAVLDSLDPEKRELLKKAFVEAGIDNADTTVKRVMDRTDLTNMRKKFMGRRADVPLRGAPTAAGKALGRQVVALTKKIAKAENPKVRAALTAEKNAIQAERAGLEAAPLLDARESIVDYMHHVAKRAGADEWRIHATERFVDQYKDVLKPELLTRHKVWYEDDIFRADLKASQAGRLRDAQQMQKFLKRTVQNTSQGERKYNRWMTNKALEFADSPEMSKRAMSRLLDKMPHAQRINALGRAFGSVPKLLFGNVAQIAVQGSQALVTVGANPIHAARGLADLMRATTAAIAEASGRRLDKESMHLLKVARESGYMADLMTNDMGRIVSHKSNPVARAAGMVSAAPFRLGEATNRGLAFFTNRHKFMSLHAGKKMNGIDDMAFKGAVDDAEFLRVVVDNAKITALNMGKAGELEALSGFNSVIFQFKQVLPKMTNIFETGRMTASEKAGAAAAMVGFWGVGAIPLLGDLVAGADYMAWGLSGGKPSNREEITQSLRLLRKNTAESLADMTSSEAGEWGINADFYDRLIKKGAFNVGLDQISDSEWDISHRVALGRFITEAYSASGDLSDLTVFTSVLADLTDASGKIGVPVTIPQFLDVVYKVNQQGLSMESVLSDTLMGDYFRGERGGYETLVQSAKEVGQAVSYVGAMAKYVENSDRILGFRYDIQTMKPGFGVTNPNQENFFISSSGQTTNVSVTPGRLRQLIFGITPGALIEEQGATNLEMRYLDALKVYRKEALEKYNNTSSQGKSRVIHDYMTEMEQFSTLLTSLRLKNVLPEDFRKSSVRMFLQNDLTRGLPKQSPLESK